MSETPVYELYAVRYAHNALARRSGNFLGGDPHDAPMPLDYFVWAIKGPQRTFILDTGFDAAMGQKRGSGIPALAFRWAEGNRRGAGSGRGCDHLSYAL